MDGSQIPEIPKKNYAPDLLQRFALVGMMLLVLLTFVGANLHALLWQSSQWLVSTVLPAVVVDLTNEERADVSEAPLRRSSVLDEAARLKAQHMANNEYFAHYAPDGTSPWFWFDRAGYVYAHAGENLAIHFTDSEEVVEAWMDSPTHRKNIVDSKFTEIGVGTAKGEFEGYDTVYVVQLFGAPANQSAPAAPVVTTTPPPPVEIEDEAPETSSESETPAVLSASPEEPEEAFVPEKEPTELPLETSPAPTEVPVIAPPDESSVIIETVMISTSSGLAVATVYQNPPTKKTSFFSGLATKPNDVLQLLYSIFGAVVLALLIASIILEAKRFRYLQMGYGMALIIVMGGLWYVHSLLTTGAVIV